MTEPAREENGMEQIAFAVFSLVVVVSFSLTVSVGVFIGWLLWGTK